MYARWFVTAVLLAGLMAGCRSASVKREAWYRAPPTDGDLYWTWPKLDAARLHEVIEERQDEAQARLEEAPLIEVRNTQCASRTRNADLATLHTTHRSSFHGP